MLRRLVDSLMPRAPQLVEEANNTGYARDVEDVGLAENIGLEDNVSGTIAPSSRPRVRTLQDMAGLPELDLDKATSRLLRFATQNGDKRRYAVLLNPAALTVQDLGVYGESPRSSAESDDSERTTLFNNSDRAVLVEGVAKAERASNHTFGNQDDLSAGSVKYSKLLEGVRSVDAERQASLSAQPKVFKVSSPSPVLSNRSSGSISGAEVHGGTRLRLDGHKRHVSWAVPIHVEQNAVEIAAGIDQTNNSARHRRIVSQSCTVYSVQSNNHLHHASQQQQPQTTQNQAILKNPSYSHDFSDSFSGSIDFKALASLGHSSAAEELSRRLMQALDIQDQIDAQNLSQPTANMEQDVLPKVRYRAALAQSIQIAEDIARRRNPSMPRLVSDNHTRQAKLEDQSEALERPSSMGTVSSPLKNAAQSYHDVTPTGSAIASLPATPIHCGGAHTPAVDRSPRSLPTLTATYHGHRVKRSLHDLSTPGGKEAATKAAKERIKSPPLRRSDSVSHDTAPSTPLRKFRNRCAIRSPGTDTATGVGASPSSSESKYWSAPIQSGQIAGSHNRLGQAELEQLSEEGAYELELEASPVVPNFSKPMIAPMKTQHRHSSYEAREPHSTSPTNLAPLIQESSTVNASDDPVVISLADVKMDSPQPRNSSGVINFLENTQKEVDGVTQEASVSMGESVENAVQLPGEDAQTKGPATEKNSRKKRVVNKVQHGLVNRTAKSTKSNKSVTMFANGNPFFPMTLESPDQPQSKIPKPTKKKPDNEKQGIESVRKSVMSGMGGLARRLTSRFAKKDASTVADASKTGDDTPADVKDVTYDNKKDTIDAVCTQGASISAPRRIQGSSNITAHAKLLGPPLDVGVMAAIQAAQSGRLNSSTLGDTGAVKSKTNDDFEQAAGAAKTIKTKKSLQFNPMKNYAGMGSAGFGVSKMTKSATVNNLCVSNSAGSAHSDTAKPGAIKTKKFISLNNNDHSASACGGRVDTGAINIDAIPARKSTPMNFMGGVAGTDAVKMKRSARVSFIDTSAKANGGVPSQVTTGDMCSRGIKPKSSVHFNLMDASPGPDFSKIGVDSIDSVLYTTTCIQSNVKITHSDFPQLTDGPVRAPTVSTKKPIKGDDFELLAEFNQPASEIEEEDLLLLSP